MHRLIVLLAVFSLVGLSAGVVYAESSPPAGYNIIDFVNIGDAAGANTEGGRNMTEWGPSFDAGIWFSPENSDYYRQIWGWTTPPGGYPAGEDTENWATIELDFTKPAYTGQLNIGFFFLAGSGTDDFIVYIDGTSIGTVTEIQSSNTMMREYLSVPAWVTAGPHTVKLECAAPGWASQATYGQVTIDEIYTFTDPLIDPVIDPIAVDADPINCSGAKLVNFHYAPGINPDVRGYSVIVQCDADLTFGAGDISFFDVPSGATFQRYVTTVTAGSAYKVDCVIMGGTVGIAAEADLFSVDFHGFATGTGEVSISSAALSALDGTPITPVIYSGTADIFVDCTAPDVPTMTAEPIYTAGTSNTVYWSDESLTGADTYYVECATDAGFTNVVYSEWVSVLFKQFTPLTDGQIYYYHVMSRDLLDNDSAFSGAVFSTQDNTAPATSVAVIDPDAPSWVDSFFDVTYTIDIAEVSGVASVDLYYQIDDLGYLNYGTFSGTTIHFDASSLDDGTYDFYTIATDNVGNVESAPGGPDDSINVDTTPPATSVDDLAGFQVDSFFDITYTLDLEAGSGPNGADLWYKKEIGGTYTNYGPFTGASPFFDTSTTGGDGTYYFYSIGTDVVGNVETVPTGPDYDTFTVVDTEDPNPVTNLTALRGHNKVTLTWTNPGDGEAELEVFRAVWYHFTTVPTDTVSAYPEYDDWTDDAIPGLPADHAAAVLDPFWKKVGTVTAPVASYPDDPLDRGIYYYVVYPVDSAGNYGAGANVSSISYLLGDINPDDGDVTGGDISVLAAAYGTSDAGGGFYNNECDVGPTDDYSGSGIPNTDDDVNFDDLMIFALNWDLTVSKDQPAAGSVIARFSWVRNDDMTLSLVLAEPCNSLKGLNLQADLPQNTVLSLTAGSLLKQQDSPYFLQNIPGNGLDSGMALLGSGACITGQGELIRISLPEDFNPEDILIVARNAANEKLEYTLEEATNLPDLPTKYSLSANYPNPFNPVTNIDFALPEPQSVKLVIYAVDGRQIATLINESLPAGHHSVTWLGCNNQGELVASGIYFYRIQAGDFSLTQKMTLLK